MQRRNKFCVGVADEIAAEHVLHVLGDRVVAKGVCSVDVFEFMEERVYLIADVVDELVKLLKVVLGEASRANEIKGASKGNRFLSYRLGVSLDVESNSHDVGPSSRLLCRGGCWLVGEGFSSSFLGDFDVC